MIELLSQEIHKHNDKFRIFSIDCLQGIQQDVANVTRDNEFVRGVEEHCYDFTLPDTSFDIRSIIVIASQSPTVRLIFNLDQKQIPITLPPTYMDMTSRAAFNERYLNDFLSPFGYHAKETKRLPKKMWPSEAGLMSMAGTISVITRNLAALCACRCSIRISPALINLSTSSGKWIYVKLVWLVCIAARQRQSAPSAP